MPRKMHGWKKGENVDLRDHEKAPEHPEREEEPTAPVKEHSLERDVREEEQYPNRRRGRELIGP
jgi:hypothetical protein